MTLTTIFVIFVIAIIVAPDIVLSYVFALIALPLMAYIVYKMVKNTSRLDRCIIERTYKVIEIGGKKYTVYYILKKCADELSKEEGWPTSKLRTLYINSNLPLGDKKPTIAVGISRKNREICISCILKMVSSGYIIRIAKNLCISSIANVTYIKYD